MWYFFKTEERLAYFSVYLNSARKGKEHLSYVPHSYVTNMKGQKKSSIALQWIAKNCSEGISKEGEVVG